MIWKGKNVITLDGMYKKVNYRDNLTKKRYIIIISPPPLILQRIHLIHWSIDNTDNLLPQTGAVLGKGAKGSRVEITN